MARSFLFLASLALVAGALAGCLGGTQRAAVSDLPDLMDTVVFEHDHAVPELHAVSHPNAMKVSYAPLLGDDEPFPRFGELDAQGDFVYVATLDVGGFLVVDVSDPANPAVVGRYVAGPQSYGADVKVSDDGKYAFLATSNYFTRVTTNQTRLQENVENAQRAPGLLAQYPYGMANLGIQVVDVSDKTAPRFAAFYPIPIAGIHMLAYHRIGGQEYFFTTALGTALTSAVSTRLDGTPLQGTVPEDELYRLHIARFERDAPGGPRVVPVSDYMIDHGPYYIHDVSVHDDPLTGAPLALLSYWDYGLHVLDVSDPASPKLLGKWEGFELPLAGNIHTANLGIVGDRRVITATEELYQDPRSVAHVYLLDATDLGDIREISNLTLPGETTVDGIRFSTHNHQIVDGRLYVAWYHAGVWAFDVDTLEKLASPTLVGYYLPHENVTYGPQAMPRPGSIDVPDTWDVVVRDGLVYASDINTGLYVLHFVGDDVGEGGRTSAG